MHRLPSPPTGHISFRPYRKDSKAFPGQVRDSLSCISSPFLMDSKQWDMIGTPPREVCIRNRCPSHLLMRRSSSWMKDETTTKLIVNLQPVLGLLAPRALMDILWLKHGVRYWQAATKSPITEHRTSSDGHLDGYFQSHHPRCHCCCPGSCRLTCRHNNKKPIPNLKVLEATLFFTLVNFKWRLPQGAISKHNIITSMLTLGNWAPGAGFQFTWEVILTLPVLPNIPKLRVFPPSHVTLHVPIAKVLVQLWVFGAPQTTLHWHLMDLPVDRAYWKVSPCSQFALACKRQPQAWLQGGHTGPPILARWTSETIFRGILAPDNKAPRIIWAQAV